MKHPVQILDYGRITDATAVTVNFENTVIIMTTNAGSDRKDGSVGFNRSINDRARKRLSRPQRFLRLNLSTASMSCVFQPFSEEDFKKIARLMLEELMNPWPTRN
jgi:ATP-dependent Clp protease ATP-binding subunit ClpA